MLTARGKREREGRDTVKEMAWCRGQSCHRDSNSTGEDRAACGNPLMPAESEHRQCQMLVGCVSCGFTHLVGSVSKDLREIIFENDFFSWVNDR